MNDQHATQLVEYLAAATGGNWKPETINAYIDEVCTWDDTAAAERAVSKVARTWMQTWSPPLGQLEQAYHDERSATRARTLTSGHGCDGSGWIEHGTRPSGNPQYRPCGTCNPALAGMFHDRNVTARWGDGTPLHKLADDVMMQNGAMHWEHEMPKPCKPERDLFDPSDPIVTVDTGKRVARAAYIEACQTDGREPNLTYFDRAIGIKAGV